VKRIILRTLERLGYKLVHFDEWSSLQGQLANQLQHALIANEAVRERANSLEARLTNCLSDCHRLGLRGDRAEVRIRALKRDRDRVRADLATCRELAAAGDPSGRLDELENENGRLRQRLADLEVYLQETRKTSGVSYL
jgi:chromosome segregation ATPase